ncbi:disease resistance protein RGA2 [Ziziphus jujuba]|uniref:Disease resistance protein RGA2 n=1 Tax=Ziziphus jujuba TaxID=326968 RepID=A0A6P4AJY8_ZIZJJ|nr:disease resistance protein RGA2 [Ziziphus jujuba]XP_048332068.2 disease resistance protein RGA2 [Ziziphus jujuba]
MADVVLSPLLQVVFDRLANPFLEEVANVCGLKKEVKKLRRTLEVVQAVLEDAEEKQFTDKALRLWLEELKEVAFDMDDLLDDLLSNNSANKFAEQVSSFIPSFGKLANYKDLLMNLNQLNQVKQTFELLVEERSNFNPKERDGNRGYRSRRGRQTGSFIIESEVFGRDEDKERIIEKLVSNYRGSTSLLDILIISIVGLGGIGKTILAQLAYNDERLTKHFDLKIWVCVNDDFDAVKIMTSIIESATKSKCDVLGMDVLQYQVREILVGKRYLLVLDDVWNEDQSEWEKLRTLFKSSVEGSAIIVTTRSEKVASIMGTTCIYHLEGLAEEDCWSLFKQRAFDRSERDPSNLFPIGKEIVKKCGGVPLAAKTLGSLMRFKRDESEWLFVQESNLWDVSTSDNGTLPALRLSYNNLPSHLKGCFAFCSIFPKNYVIKKEKLIQLWIAAGLLQSPKGEKSLEFIGNGYFNDLVWLFFFQDIQKNDSGNITECKMHDLIHDLARSVSGNEFLMLEESNMTKDFSCIRHSSVVCNFNLYTIPEALYEAKKLRTLILLLPKGNLGEIPSGVFSSFRYLRILDLSSSGIKKLHESISSFLFLRYLDLSNTHIRELPESICALCNLQVLNIFGCYNLIELPSQIANLSKLRHLIITGCERLTKMPHGMGKMIYLRTLSLFIVGTETGTSLNQLGNLNLGGELSISQLENVMDEEEAKSADLIGKRNLQSLDLSWGNHSKGSYRDSNNNDVTPEKVLESLQPQAYLRRLSIKGYGGIRFPDWLGDLKVPNLIEIVLMNCRSCKNLPTLGKLPFLKVLYLQGMDAVKTIGSEFYGEGITTPFSSLRELSLIDFPNLEYWWSVNGREQFPSLVKLTVNKCLRLKNMPSFPLLKDLVLRSCSDALLRSTTSVTSLTSLIIEEFPEQLIFLECLLQNNSLLVSLKISSCPKLQSISPYLGKLINLRTLTVRWCGELLSLPEGLRNLTLLDSLEITECHSLTSLPECIQGLSSLRSLSIENCNNITSLLPGLKFLSALEHLTIMFCPVLSSLPDDLQHLSTLKSLCIMNCPQLGSLPDGLQYTTTLQNMEIRSCPGLQALPEWVGYLTSLRSLTLSDCHNLASLPGSFQCLSSIQHLSIRECPNLEERCKKDVGEDWPKLKHIAHVYIGPLHFGTYESGGSSSR